MAHSPDDQAADSLLSGKLKKSRSYHAGYGAKTYKQIKQLAAAGDKKARQMKKLIEQRQRLSNKLRGKRP
jgi:hypothetical protein